jgi:CheY-like chemotaxis protein
VGAEGKHFLQIITNTGTMMLYLINDVLDLAQIEANKLSLNKALFSPKDLIDETIQLMQFNFQQKNLSLVARYVWNLPREINSDKTRYRQILLNLLGNALKFTIRGSVSVEVHYNLRTDTLITQVRDTGSGITAEELPKLFQIFGRLESNRVNNPSGVGLGLHICKSLSQLLGGDIYVESEFGHGSTFTFHISCGLAPNSEEAKPPTPTEAEIKDFVYHSRLNEEAEDEKNSDHSLVAKADAGNDSHQVPLVNDYKHCGQETHTRPEMTPTSPRPETLCDCARVLLVDDNQVNLFMLKSFLANVKNRVQVAYNGQEAVEKVLQKAQADCCKKYDVIYMDLNMPIMDGVAATLELRRHMDQGTLGITPIIALSAESLTEQEAHDLCQHGFVSFLPKPISKAAFLDSARKYTTVVK